MDTNAPAIVYTDEEIGQLADFGDARNEEELLAFVARQDLTDNVIIKCARLTRDEKALQALGSHHASNVALAEFSLRTLRDAVTQGMAEGHPSAEVTELFAHHTVDLSRSGGHRQRPGSPSAYFFGIVDLKRKYVAERQTDPEAVEALAHHDCPILREEATKYVSRDIAIELLKDHRSGRSQRAVVIRRFPDDPEVGELIGGQYPLASRIDDIVGERWDLAVHTKRRETAVLLRVHDNINRGASEAIAQRWANDPEMARYFIDSRTGLSSLAQWTTRPEVIAELRELVLKTAFPSTGPMKRQLEGAGRALAKRLPDDAELARALADYPTYVVTAMAEASSSREVFLALAGGRSARFEGEVRRDIAHFAKRDPEVVAKLEDSRLTGIESTGGFTTRSLSQTSDVNRVLSALRHGDPEIADAARAQLRALSTANSSLAPPTSAEAPTSSTALTL